MSIHQVLGSFWDAPGESYEGWRNDLLIFFSDHLVNHGSRLGDNVEKYTIFLNCSISNLRRENEKAGEAPSSAHHGGDPWPAFPANRSVA